MKFDWKKFKGNGKMCVHCKTKDEAERFCKMMDEHGMKWCTGSSFLKCNNYSIRLNETVYFGDGKYGDRKYAGEHHCSIFEFSDYLSGCKSPYPTITITTDGKTTTATMSKGGKVLKKADVSLYYKDKFSLATGAEEALKKLFGKQERVKEVKRPAKAGDYIKLIREPYSFNKVGDILRVDGIAYGGSPFVLKKNHPRYVENGNEQWYYFPSQYVVLENYKPQEDK